MGSGASVEKKSGPCTGNPWPILYSAEFQQFQGGPACNGVAIEYWHDIWLARESQRARLAALDSVTVDDSVTITIDEEDAQGVVLPISDK